MTLPRGAYYSLAKGALSPFQAEPAQSKTPTRIPTGSKYLPVQQAGSPHLGPACGAVRLTLVSRPFSRGIASVRPLQ
jgi:hypothetical protein